MALVVRAGDGGTRVTLYEAVLIPQGLACGAQTFGKAVEAYIMHRTHKKPWLRNQYGKST